MASHVYDFGWTLAAIVQVVVIFFLISGPFRKFLVLFAYLLLDFVSTLALTLADVLYGGSMHVSVARASDLQKLYTHLYWTGEVVLDLLLFMTVIVLTYRATDEGRVRTAAGKLLGVVALLAVLLPFVLFHPKFTPWPNGFWFNSTSQLLNFGGAIMNLALWTALIASKRRDPQLLTVSAGLGILVTGAAISFGLRHFISLNGPRWIPDLLLLLTHLSALIIWCRAFRPAAKPRQVPSDALTSH
jgi:hypothetical protein